MYLIEVKVESNRFVKCETLNVGNIGENNITRLKFIVPKEYSEFYKYLDIILFDGTKTQTVEGDLVNNIFYYDIPYSLSENKELIMQLVMKKDKKIFISNLFTFYFNSTIEATQVLLGDYKDTIEYIMENKADISEVSKLNNKVNNKLEKGEFYNYYTELTENINTKVSQNEYMEFKEDNKKSIERKVDKVDGKKLSSEDFTTVLKNKLLNIESGAQVNPTNISELNNDVGYLTTHQSLEDYLKIDVANILLNSKADIEYVNEKIGDINSALDELHNYAQALIGGV